MPFTWFIIFLSILVICAGNIERDTWNSIVQKQHIVVSVKYGDLHLSVWKEDKKFENYSHFYVMPIGELINGTTKCLKDTYLNNGRHIVSFKVRMWSNELAKLVQLELKKKNINASPEDIKPLDMTLFKLDINKDIKPTFYIDEQWRTHQNAPSEISFQLYTENKVLCKQLVVDAIENIDYFLVQLKPVFLFTIIAEQQHSYKNLDITGRMVAKTEIFSKLENIANQDGNTYLSSNDLNDLSQEVINDVIVSVKQSSDYIPDAEEESIIKQLTSSLTEAKVQARQLSDNQWDSVFWNDIFSRPDIQTQYFNDVITFDKNTNEFKYNNESDRKYRHNITSKYEDSHFKEQAGGGGFSFAGFGINANGGRKDGGTKNNESSVFNNTETRDVVNREEMNEFIDYKKANVYWTGEKFTMKDLSLHRLNTRKLVANDKILYSNVKVNKVELPVQIEISQEKSPVYFESPSVYDELKQHQNQIDSTNLQLQNLSQIVNTNYQSLYKEMSDKSHQIFTNISNIETKLQQNIDKQVKSLDDSIKSVRSDMDNNIGKLRNEMNNNIGNLRNEMNSQLGNYVQKPKRARLYEHPNNQGNYWVLSISNECNSDVWSHHQMNDRASSIDVQGNCVILYEHPNCVGHSARFDAHCSNGCCGDLRKCGINDKVSSYKGC